MFSNEVKNRSTFTAIDSLNGDFDIEGNVQVGRVRGYTFNYKPQRPIKRISNELGSDFWETQIWGALTVNDVDYFLINCPGDDITPPESIKNLAQTGIGIYQCLYLQDHSHFGKGKVIFEGKPQKKTGTTNMVGNKTSQMLVK